MAVWLISELMVCLWSLYQSVFLRSMKLKMRAMSEAAARHAGPATPAPAPGRHPAAVSGRRLSDSLR